VALGNSTIYGLDYFHSSSPVATMVAFRLIIAIAVVLDMDITGGDIEGAYLNADLSEDLDEPLYMRPPAGFEDPTGKGRVIRLSKSIYGLKNASFCWFRLLSSVMRDLGYRAVDGSECFWYYSDGDDKGLFAVHVDDYMHAFNNKELDNRLVNKFSELWGVSGVGPIDFHLGMEIQFEKGKSATISQRVYFEKVLKRFGYDSMKPVDTPMDSTLKISIADSDDGEALGDDERRRYMEIVGSLIYGATVSRPDIANAVAQLGRVMNRPSKSHLAAAKRVLRYVAGTLDRGLRYENKPWKAPGIAGEIAPNKIVAYADSDWAGDVDSRKSMSGNIVFMAGGVISFKAALQKIQALSSAEAEYVSLSDASRELVYIYNVLRELNVLDQDGPLPLLSDSSAALAMARNKGVNHRTKHIELRYHFIRSLIDDKKVDVEKIDTDDNPADLLTKATGKETFTRHADACVPRVKHA